MRDSEAIKPDAELNSPSLFPHGQQIWWPFHIINLFALGIISDFVTARFIDLWYFSIKL